MRQGLDLGLGGKFLCFAFFEDGLKELPQEISYDGLVTIKTVDEVARADIDAMMERKRAAALPVGGRRRNRKSVKKTRKNQRRYSRRK